MEIVNSIDEENIKKNSFGGFGIGWKKRKKIDANIPIDRVNTYDEMEDVEAVSPHANYNRAKESFSKESPEHLAKAVQTMLAQDEED